jgi:DNA-binding NtrC family response regulator
MKPDKKILIFMVEDNEVYALMLDQIIKEQYSYRLVSYTTGEECLTNLYLKPDIIILDFALPGMSGLETLKEIKKRSPKTPVIVLSGQKDMKNTIEMFHEGAYDYIMKSPESPQLVMDCIERIHAEM